MEKGCHQSPHYSAHRLPGPLDRDHLPSALLNEIVPFSIHETPEIKLLLFHSTCTKTYLRPDSISKIFGWTPLPMEKEMGEENRKGRRGK
jgi:hypothetical protein